MHKAHLQTWKINISKIGYSNLKHSEIGIEGDSSTSYKLDIIGLISDFLVNKKLIGKEITISGRLRMSMTMLWQVIENRYEENVSTEWKFYISPQYTAKKPWENITTIKSTW